MEYIGVKFKSSHQSYDSEMLIAFLLEIGFDSFEEQEDRLIAYILISDFNEEKIKSLLTNEKFQRMDICYNYEKLKDRNWNKIWESNYQAIKIADNCLIRASFHEPDKSVEYDIVIDPKMSFGTAHHETTSLMIEYILEDSFDDKDVLDMGCGTGVLAILAAKKGAKSIDAIDNDEWAYRNSINNVKMNKIDNINVFIGDSGIIKNKEYGIILANINLNILIENIPHYAKSLKNNGVIYFSGFYKDDLDKINKAAISHGFKMLNSKTKNSWTAAKFVN
ncbi:MAG: 50S ribosomal protein L11 methyltransferase [Bacteroidetes bacterium]|nr:50S ribosomal protein L11 methyltransferase [Bacteroidota bacterium]